MPKFVGATLDFGGVRATNGFTPSASTDVAIKSYVDSLIGTIGAATLAAGQAVVSFPSITSSSRVWLTPQDSNTYGALRAVVNPGVGFTIFSNDTTDSGVVAWSVGNLPTAASSTPISMYQSPATFRWSQYHQSKMNIVGTAPWPYLPGTATMTGPGVSSAITLIQMNGATAHVNVGDAITSIKVTTGVGQTIAVGDTLTITQAGGTTMTVVAQTAVAASTANAVVTTSGAVCGTFTALSSSAMIDIQIMGTNLGGAWGGVILAVGVSPNPATTPIFTSLTFPGTAAAGVTEFQWLQVGALEIDGSAGPPTRHAHLVTGLTPGTVYTWQVVMVAQSSSFRDTLTAAVAFGKMVYSPDNNWLACTLQGSNQVQLLQVGARPGWRFGTGYAADQMGGNWVSVVKAAITVGSGPISLAFSPDNTKLAVCNYTAGTVTFITVATGAVIGTSAVVHGAATNTTGVAWTDDGTAVLVAVSDGSLNAVTAVASPVITNVATGLGTNGQDGLRRRGTGNLFWVRTTTAVIQGHMPTNTSWTTDLTTSPTGATGTPTWAIDGASNGTVPGNAWVAVLGGTFNGAVIKIASGSNAIAQNFVPKAGTNPSMMATTADGGELWMVMADLTAGAVQSSDGAMSQAWLVASYFQPLGTSPAIQGLAESNDGYLAVAYTSTVASGVGGPGILENPSAVTSIVPGLPSGQGVLVTAQGVNTP